MIRLAGGVLAAACLSACALPIEDAQGKRLLVVGFGLVELPERSDEALLVETRVVGAAVEIGEQGAVDLGYSSARRLFVPPNYAWTDPDLIEPTMEDTQECQEGLDETIEDC